MIDDALDRAASLDRSGDAAGAMDVLAAVADDFEIVPDRLCARLAQVCAKAGRPDEAARWAVRTVDGGDGFKSWRTAARVLAQLPGEHRSSMRHLRVGVLSTATITPLVPCLRLALARAGIDAEIHETPFGQYWQEAIDPSAGLRTFDPDVVVLFPDHHALHRASEVDDPETWVGEETARWTAPWTSLRSWSSAELVQLSFVHPEHDPFGFGAASVAASFRARLRALDDALARATAREGVALVDIETLAGAIGKRRWFDPRYWHVAKHPFSMEVAPELALRVAATTAARVGLSRKVLVTDLDNTLWHGVIGDDGLGGIELSGPRGEAHVDFQRAIAQLADRGIVLAACSKNDDKTARQPFVEHPDMAIDLTDFAAFVANWEPKAENLRTISRQLDLPLDSFVFADDNPAERAAVRHALPMVDVLELSDDPATWRSDLGRYPWFEPGSLTDDDRRRTEVYRARAQAAELAEGTASMDDFLVDLQMNATIAPIDELSFDRVVQLIGKTNQFNVTTRRHSRETVRGMVADPTWVHLTARLEDRFADHGLVAVALASEDDGVLDIDTLLMSCRVIGRGLETALIEELIAVAVERDLPVVRAHYQPTERNRLVRDLWTDHGFREVGSDDHGRSTFELDAARHEPRSTHITIRRPDE